VTGSLKEHEGRRASAALPVPRGRLTILQMLPALEVGGVERGTLQVAAGLRERGHRALVMSAGGRLVGSLEASGAEHLAWPIGRKRLATLSLIAPLSRLLLEQAVDVVHARSRLPAWVAWSAIQRLPPAQRPRFVTGCHGPYTPNGYSAIVARGERVIAISQTIREYLLAHYPNLDPERVRVVPRGVSTVDFPFGYRPSPDWLQRWQTGPFAAGDRWVITLPGRLTRWKGQLDFIDVIGRLKQAGIPALGLIVGGAERRRAGYAGELAQAITAAGLDEQLRLVGHRDDLREVMAVSQAVLSITREPEAFGRTTLEALALGVPVAGYDHGGTGEILRRVFIEGLCPSGKPSVVADRLGHWYARHPRLPPLHAFSLEAMVAGEIAVYEEVALRE
jgi:glycosyltransferase involved in cell wall biosynthesis